MRKLLTGFASLLAATSLPLATAQAADHGDAPLVRLQSNLDINDVYLFQSPATPTNTVMIMTVSPVAGITGSLNFDDSANYEIVLDNNGDAKPDRVFSFKFGRANANQRFVLTSTDGRGRQSRRLAAGTVETDVAVNGGGTVRAGNFDDPFFFDLLSFRDGLNFCTPSAENFFTGLNTLAVVLEVPTSTLVSNTGTQIGIWGRTIDLKTTNPRPNVRVTRRVQIDRMGRPAINTVLVTSANKDKFNKGQPATDLARFGPDARTIITSLGNGANADSLVSFLFPDILTMDTASSAGFPNGRKLEDDVIDAELQLLTGNSGASDCVANDSTFRTTFPYLGLKNP